MCKNELDLASIVEGTERTWFHLQTDGQTDKVKPIYSPLNFVEMGVIMIAYCGIYAPLGLNEMNIPTLHNTEHDTQPTCPEKCGWIILFSFFFQIILEIDTLSIICETAVVWMLLKHTDDK